MQNGTTIFAPDACTFDPEDFTIFRCFLTGTVRKARQDLIIAIKKFCLLYYAGPPTSVFGGISFVCL